MRLPQSCGERLECGVGESPGEVPKTGFRGAIWGGVVVGKKSIENVGKICVFLLFNHFGRFLGGFLVLLPENTCWKVAKPFVSVISCDLEMVLWFNISVLAMQLGHPTGPTPHFLCRRRCHFQPSLKLMLCSTSLGPTMAMHQIENLQNGPRVLLFSFYPSRVF